MKVSLVMHKPLVIFVCIVAALTCLFTFRSKGTDDVDNWLSIIERIRKNPVNVFPGCLKYDCAVLYPATYPPGHFLPVYLATVLLPSSLKPILVFKIVLFAGFTAAVVSVFYFTYTAKQFISISNFRCTDVVVITFITISLLLNTLGQGYTDILFFAPLILSMIFLYRCKFIRAGIFYGFAILLKWQPLILLPLIFAYILKSSRQNTAFPMTKLINGFISLPLGLGIPFALLLPLNPSIFQSSAYSFIWGAGGDPILANALNFQWLATYLYKILFPQLYGGLTNGALTYLDALASYVPRILFIIPKLSFIAIYGLLILKYYKETFSRDNFTPFLKMSLIISITYYMVSSSVHENHLALAVLVGVLVYLLQPTRLNRLVIFAVSTLNLASPFVFYGYNGFIFSRTWGNVDISVVLSLVLSIFYIRLMKRMFLGTNSYLPGT